MSQMTGGISHSLQSNHIRQTKKEAAVHGITSTATRRQRGWLDSYLLIAIRSRYRELAAAENNRSFSRGLRPSIYKCKAISIDGKEGRKNQISFFFPFPSSFIYIESCCSLFCFPYCTIPQERVCVVITSTRLNHGSSGLRHILTALFSSPKRESDVDCTAWSTQRKLRVVVIKDR